jgi:hypothetical protein
MKKIIAFVFILILYFIAGCTINHEEDFHCDPIDHDPAYKTILKAVDKEIKNDPEYQERKGKMGACHIYWRLKKEILKERYNIDWKSPADCHPEIIFD